MSILSKQSIKKNFVFQASYEILLVALPILTSPYVSRVLGASNIGIYSYTYTIAYYFTLVAALGIKNYGNREISRCRDNKEALNQTFSGILFLHFIISSVVIIGYFIYCLSVESDYKLFFLIQSLYLFGTLFDISWLFFGLELFKTTVMRNAIIKILSVVMIFLIVKTKDDLWKYILILAVANFASQIYLWFKIKPLVKIVKVTKHDILRHFPQMLILFVPTIAVSFYNYMDKIMLGSMAGTIELGYYENAFKITTVCSSLIGSVGTVMLPRMSNVIAKGDIHASKKYIRVSMSCVIFMACAMAFGISGVANVFAPVFWGSDFSACSLLLALLAIYLPIQGFASVLRTQFLIPNRWDKQYTISLCIGAIVNVIVNFLLIPNLHSTGAVLGTIAAETSVCLTQILFVRKSLPIKLYIFKNLPFVGIGAIMFAVLRGIQYIMRTSIVLLVVQIITGVLIYLVLSLLYCFISKNEIYNIILKMIKSRKCNS